MAASDAGNIKVTVEVEYDGSGLQEAKQDLASLADVSGGTVGGTASIGEALSALSERAGITAESTRRLTSSVSELERPLLAGQTALSGVSGALIEGRQAVSEMGSTFEALQEPLSSSMTLLEEAAPPMAAIAEHATAIQEQFGNVSDNLAQMHDSFAQSVPLLPQFADSLHGVNESFNASAYGLDDFEKNMSVFQDSLESPAPFSMIQQHLSDTGQSWDDFTSSIGDDNTAMLHQMATTSDETHSVMGGMSADFEKSGKQIADSIDWEAVGPPTDWAAGMSEAGSAVKDTGAAVEDAGHAMKSISFGEALSGAGTGIMDTLNSVAMPLMAVQMIGMVVGQVGQGIYDMAAIAEGPAAHGVGTFTGTVDALSQSTQKAAAAFSEGFGQGVLPTLQAMNYQASQSSGTGGIGGFLGFLGSTLLNLAEIGTGINPIGGGEGLINQAASMAGLPMPFQGPPPTSQAQLYYQQQMAAVPQTVEMATAQARVQSTITLAEATDPGYLAAQNQLTASQQLAQRLQQSYDISHPISQQDLYMEAQYQNYVQKQQIAMSGPPVYAPLGQSIGDYWGGVFGGVGNFFGGMGNFMGGAFGQVGGLFSGAGNWFENLFGGGTPAPATRGCFAAGTQVTLANGSRKAIETLVAGEIVEAHDGIESVTATVRALIAPPPKQTYTLHFSYGITLTLTDAHPIATPLEGWKALSVEHARQENPDLPISVLRVGDSVCTSFGACTLLQVEPHAVVPVYTIATDGPHTFYANNILVHNKMEVGTQISDQVSGIQLPHIDLSGITASLASAFSGIQMPHLDLSGMISGLASTFSGIQLPHLDLSGMISGLAGEFSGIQLPHLDLSGITTSLSGLFSGIQIPHLDLSGITSSLSGLFSGIQLPSLPDLGGMINKQMSTMFSGIQLPSLPNIAGAINSLLSNLFSGLTMPSIPAFAGGVENFSGGAALIAEGGPELVMLPGGSSVYPLSTGAGVSGNMTPLALGGGGSGAPQSVNLVVQLDSQSILSAVGMPLAANIRVASGMRGF